MNILIPHSWLKDFIKTTAKPEQIAEKLSLCALSVEKLHQKGQETVYEIETTANRSDTLSVLGVAREINAVLPRFGIKSELTPPEIPNEVSKAKNKDPLFDVKIADPTLIPRFAAIVLKNIKVKKSPQKIQKRLELSGIRPLNNVIDISNYLMLELGQPMHIFDFDRLGGKLLLRESRKGEKIVTLDGRRHQLPAGAIVIEANGNLVDLCGLMGAKNSAVSQNTKRILLFVQIYDPLRIRRTSKDLALRTEASARFEKGIDPAGVLPAVNKAITMLKELANAQVASCLTDINNDRWEPHNVSVEIPQIKNLLGVSIDQEEIIQILKSLGFEVLVKNSALRIPTLEVKVPSWRAGDIKIPEDLIEEVARLYGYFKLPAEMPAGEIPTTPREKIFDREEKAKLFLKHQGFFEVYNYSFVSAAVIKSAGSDPQKAVKITNPLNKDLEILRPSLLPSLLSNLAANQYRAEELRLFELERVFLQNGDEGLPNENFRLTGIIFNQSSSAKATEDLRQFYVAKGIVEGLLKEMGINNQQFKPVSQNTSTIALPHPTGVRDIGLVGLVETSILEKFAIKGQVAYFSLDFDLLTDLATDRKTFTPIPKHPPVIEDLSIVVDEKVLVGDIKNEIEASSSKNLVVTTKILDIYRDEELKSKGQKSVTFRLYFRADDRSLSEGEASKERRRVGERLKKIFSAVVRE